MNQIVKFLQDHKISTHTIALAIMFLVTAYAEVPAFHQLVSGIEVAHPNLSEAATAFVGVFMLYWKSNKTDDQGGK